MNDCKFAYKGETKVMCNNINIIKATLRFNCRHPHNQSKCSCYQSKRKDFFDHYTNPLQLFCRLRDIGVKKELAAKITKCYERIYTKLT